MSSRAICGTSHKTTAVRYAHMKEVLESEQALMAYLDDDDDDVRMLITQSMVC